MSIKVLLSILLRLLKHCDLTITFLEKHYRQRRLPIWRAFNSESPVDGVHEPPSNSPTMSDCNISSSKTSVSSHIGGNLGNLGNLGTFPCTESTSPPIESQLSQCLRSREAQRPKAKATPTANTLCKGRSPPRRSARLLKTNIANGSAEDGRQTERVPEEARKFISQASMKKRKNDASFVNTDKVKQTETQVQEDHDVMVLKLVLFMRC